MTAEDQPFILQIFKSIEAIMPLTDWLVIIKAISTVVVVSIFYYHAISSANAEFQSNYPRLYSKLDLKYYDKVKWTFALFPFADLLFYYLLIRNRYTTVAFLKAFGVKNVNRYY